MQLLQEHIATSALQRQPLAAYLKLFYLNLRGNARERAAAYRTSTGAWRVGVPAGGLI